MKNKEKLAIRRQVGNIFNMVIQDWDEDFEVFDRENRVNNKYIVKILLIILKRLEEIEEDGPTD